MWQQARLWWIAYTGEEDTPLDGDTPAWVISIAINIGLLVVLGAVGMHFQHESTATIVVSTLPDEAEIDFEPVLHIETIGGQPNEGRPQSAADPVVVPVEHIADTPAPGDMPIEPISPVSPATRPSEPTAADLTAPISVAAASLEASTTASGVLDRLTMEIVASLEQRSTVVCWVFDRSLSLAKQRTEIAGRLDRIATEIDATPGAKANDLLNLVYGYGQWTTRVTAKPTADIGTVANAIRAIPIDDSGVEMTFGAVERAAHDAVEMRRRLHPGRLNIMVVLFTDEAGDDQEIADRVATFCSRAAVRVFVVGVPAPFGQRAVRFKFKEFDPQYADVETWAQVDQGPESRWPEVVRILMGGPLDSPIDSGFGPFSLCKLCRITGGTYFAVHPDRHRRDEVKPGESAAMASHLRYFFDPDVMRAYRPMHDSDLMIKKELAANAAKRALVMAADHTADRPLAGLSRQVMRFLATDQARLIKDLGEAQKESASLEPRIEELLRSLEAGRGDRLKLTDEDRRWRAGYDLALGRTLALKARTVGYNMMLAEAKSKKFHDDRNNTWILERSEPADDKALDSRLKKVIDEAEALLERVVQEHQGTPWALIAAEELRTPLGYSWREAHTPPPPPPKPAPPPGPPPPPRPPEDDKPRELPKPKPRVLPTRI